jgi:hypothetical protein
LRSELQEKKALTILNAMQDPVLFGPWFKGNSWDAWRSFLGALFGLPMNKVALESYREHTGRYNAPESPAREGWLW